MVGGPQEGAGPHSPAQRQQRRRTEVSPASNGPETHFVTMVIPQLGVLFSSRLPVLLPGLESGNRDQSGGTFVPRRLKPFYDDVNVEAVGPTGSLAPPGPFADAAFST